MSQLQTNDSIEFEERASAVSRYQDEYGNNWIIEITGDPKVVLEMVEQKRFVIKAIPFGSETSDEDWQRVEKSLLESPEDPEKGVNDDESTDPVPELYMNVSLVNVKEPELAYAFHIEIDPSIYGGFHRYRFSLRTQDLDLHIRVNQIQGSVNYSSYSTNGGFTGNAKVRYLSGNPAKYDITSHAEGQPIN